MLEEMRIRGLGVIDDATLDFGAGLTVLTGETGAGKTMVVQGLALLLGGRADPARVRPGAARAVVEGRLAVEDAGPGGARAAERAVEAGGELDDGVLLVARSVGAQGRSRAHVGGAAVPVGVLAEVTGELVTISGQSDQHRLARPGTQRELLDRYAGAAAQDPLARYAAAYGRAAAVSAQLAELTGQARDRAQEADVIAYGLAEVTAAAPLPGEDAELAAEVSRLANADGLRAAAGTAHELLSAGAEDGVGSDAAALVGAARRAVSTAAGADPQLAALAARLDEVGYLLGDVATDLAAYAAAVEADPARLAAAQDRQAVLAGLTRKYGADIGEVLAWARRAEQRLADLQGDDERIAGLAQERDQLRGVLAEAAGELTAARSEAAVRLAAAATAELAELAMPHARICVEVGATESPTGLPLRGRTLAYGPGGVDEVEILLAPHPGSPPLPLARGASGGELSRVLLALEVALAGVDPVPTFVFDEVDAGVGGRAAVEVGRRLARLSRTAQVLVVTHLPQVAAFADAHLLVVKDDDGTVTRSGVTGLDESGRLRELSRMLAGQEDSDLARGHARELLAAARSGRSP